MLAPRDLTWGVPAPEVDGGRVTGALHLLDLSARVDHPAVVLAALQERVAVVVGVARGPLGADARVLASACDLTLTTRAGRDERCVVAVDDLDAGLQTLTDACAAAPRAAVVTAALLRSTGFLPVAQGLAAEAGAYSTLLAGPEHAAWLAGRGPGRDAPDEGDRVALDRDGNLLRLRLTRPRRRNAFDAAMRDGLYGALEVALADPALRVRLSGEGPVFSAGGDLDEFGRLADPATAYLVRTGQHPGRLLHLLGDRVEVHVHGACAGAGVELPAFAARVTADPATTLRLPELAMGLLPGAGGTVSLPARIGRWRTLWMSLTGAAVDAPTALGWGLVDELRA